MKTLHIAVCLNYQTLKLLPEKIKAQKKHNAIRCKAEDQAVLRKTHNQKMACERQLASERVKGKVPLEVTSLNARSITNKLSAIRHIFVKQKWMYV